jgi:citrate synthase
MLFFQGNRPSLQQIREKFMSDTLTINYAGQQHEIPLIQGTEGDRAIDIRKLRTKTGLVTLDPGYGNTGSCESAITYIDGEKGILRYRGIPIEQFEENPNFVEVAWLLIFGKLPTAEEYAAFSARRRRWPSCPP